ncbi:MAG TPA: lactate racemase domain-containing protein, partial [Burkholderiales bacterium]
MIGDRIEVNIAGGLDITLPRMVHIRQKFKTQKVANVSAVVAEQFKRPEVRAKVKPGMSIAVGVGSRGIANIAECTRQVIAELKAIGAKPFVFPAMGSHGGATAEGQQQVLTDYGVTESYVGCPIRSSLEVVQLGSVDGMPVYMDKLASEADGFAFVCRIKPHTNFRAPIESGIVKMMTIGMGKITG